MPKERKHGVSRSGSEDGDSIFLESDATEIDLEPEVFEDAPPKALVLSGHQRRGRVAIQAIVGSFWLLGIVVALTVIGVCVALAASNPITLPVLLISLGAAVLLLGVFMAFSHVRDYFLKKLERIAKWFISDLKQTTPKLEDNKEEPIKPLARVSSLGDSLKENKDCLTPPLSFRDPQSSPVLPPVTDENIAISRRSSSLQSTFV